MTIPTFRAENIALMSIAISNAIGMVIPNLYYLSGEFTIEKSTKYKMPKTTMTSILFNMSCPMELSEPLK